MGPNADIEAFLARSGYRVTDKPIEDVIFHPVPGFPISQAVLSLKMRNFGCLAGNYGPDAAEVRHMEILGLPTPDPLSPREGQVFGTGVIDALIATLVSTLPRHGYRGVAFGNVSDTRLGMALIKRGFNPDVEWPRVYSRAIPEGVRDEAAAVAWEEERRRFTVEDFVHMID